MKRGQKQQISLHKHKTRSIRTEDRSHRPGWCYVTLTPCKRTEGRSHRPGWRYVTLTPCKRAEDRSHRPSWRYVTLTPTKRREGRNKGPSSSRCSPNRNERPFGQWSYSNRWKFSRPSTIANNWKLLPWRSLRSSACGNQNKNFKRTTWLSDTELHAGQLLLKSMFP